MINNKKILAVILARKNSAGLPGKNYRPLLGLPCFLWSVKAAVQSKYIDLVAVSSYCPHVRDAWAKTYNKAIYLQRPEELNGPLVKNEDVLKYSVKECQERHGFCADLIITLQPTSPIRTNNLIDRCLEKMEEEQADSLLTVTEHYPFVWKDKKNGAECPNMYYLNRPMRQQMKKEDLYFIDNGNVYITKKNILMKENNRLGGKVSIYKINKYQSFQIDTLQDFEIIEKIGQVHGLV